MKTLKHVFLVTLLLTYCIYGNAQITCYTPTNVSGFFRPANNISQCSFNGLDQFLPLSTDSTLYVRLNFHYLMINPTHKGTFKNADTVAARVSVIHLNNAYDSLYMPRLHYHPTPAYIKHPKIKFIFNSFEKKYDSVAYYVPKDVWAPLSAYTGDPNAIDIIFNADQIESGYGVANGIPGKALRLVSNNSSRLDTSYDWLTSISVMAHELGHCLGLFHRNNDSYHDPYVNDAYVEGPGVWNVGDSCSIYGDTLHSNNFMAYNYNCTRYLSPRQIARCHNTLRNSLFNTLTASSQLFVSNPQHNPCVNGGTVTAYGIDTLTGGWLNPPGDLIISSGSDITLLDCMVMKKGAKIIVEPGAKFSVTNGNITSLCTSWEGIEVRSYPGGVQGYYPGNPNMPSASVGMLKLTNATISYAVTGVTMGERNGTGNYVPYTGGGFLFSKNTKYINNTTAVKFNPYFIPGGGSGDDNASYFKKDTFIVDEYYQGIISPIAGVMIEQTNIIDFFGCYFKDLDSITSTAIKCHDGAINVKDYCDNLSGSTCVGNLTQSTFIGFKRAISIATALCLRSSFIDHVLIDQRVVHIPTPGSAFPAWNRVEGGIYIDNNFGTQITNSTILTIRKGSTSLPINYGLYLDNCDGYVVENNVFEGYLYQKTVGICVNNCGPGANSIYNNTITAHDQGIWAQDLNFDVNTGAGLIMNCNDFSSSNYNIGVQGVTPFACNYPCTSPSYVVSGIATTQGIAGNASHPEYNVRNTYAVNSCSTNAENKYFVDTQNNFLITSHGSFSASVFQPTPQVSASCSNSLELVNIVGVPPPSLIKSSYCQVNYMASFANRDLADNISTHRGNIATYSSNYNSALDGGSTSTLLVACSPTGLDPDLLKHELLSKDYLSDTILKTYFTKEGVSHEYLEMVFEKNAPLSPSVWSLVPGIGLDAGELVTWDSIQSLNKLSDRAVIESQLTMVHAQLGLFNNEKIRRFLGDSAGPVYDSIISIYRLNELPNSRYKLGNIYIAANRVDSANAVINGFLANEATENIGKLLRYGLRLRTDSTYTDTLRADSTHFDYLFTLANSNVHLVEGYSKALLQNVYNYKVEEIRLSPPDDGDDEGERKATQTSTETSKVKDVLTEKGIRIYPNPASNKLNIEVASSADLFKIHIVDLTGKILLEQECRQNCIIDLSPLLNGVYLLNLYKQDKFVSVKKIVIIK